MKNNLNIFGGKLCGVETLVYNLALLFFGEKTRLSRMIKRVYDKFLYGREKDTPVLARLNHQFFLCPFSHKLLFYQKEFPLYDRQLSKLCLFMKKKLRRPLNIIDVGANVGDSVLNIGDKDAFYLCIEGDNTFSSYIRANLKKYNYSLEECLLSDIEDELPYSMITSQGTGHLVKQNEREKTSKLVTLDSLVMNKYSDKSFDLLKIDTDGFDFKVIRGAIHLLQKQHPLLFFEWDKAFLKDQGEDVLSIFPILIKSSYSKCILFDNFGNLVDKVEIDDYQNLKNYIDSTHGTGLPFYYDVLVIPETSAIDGEQLYSLFRNN